MGHTRIGLKRDKPDKLSDRPQLYDQDADPSLTQTGLLASKKETFKKVGAVILVAAGLAILVKTADEALDHGFDQQDIPTDPSGEDFDIDQDG